MCSAIKNKICLCWVKRCLNIKIVTYLREKVPLLNGNGLFNIEFLSRAEVEWTYNQMARTNGWHPMLIYYYSENNERAYLVFCNAHISFIGIRQNKSINIKSYLFVHNYVWAPTSISNVSVENWLYLIFFCIDCGMQYLCGIRNYFLWRWFGSTDLKFILALIINTNVI